MDPVRQSILNRKTKSYHNRNEGNIVQFCEFIETLRMLNLKKKNRDWRQRKKNYPTLWSIEK
jgi:hypothetical protein